MKKLFMLFAFVAGAMTVSAQNADELTAKATVSSDGAEVSVVLDNSTSFVAFQMDITFPEGFNDNDKVALEPMVRLQDSEGNVPTIDGSSADFTLAHNWINATTLRVIGYNLGNMPVQPSDDEDNTIFTITLSDGENALSDDDWNCIAFNNVIFVTEVGLNEQTLGSATVDNNGVVIETGGLLGDVNKDGDVDLNDVIALVPLVLEGDQEAYAASEGLSMKNSDVNEDGDVDLNDLVEVIQLSLN